MKKNFSFLVVLCLIAGMHAAGPQPVMPPAATQASEPIMCVAGYNFFTEDEQEDCACCLINSCCCPCIAAVTACFGTFGCPRFTAWICDEGIRLNNETRIPPAEGFPWIRRQVRDRHWSCLCSVGSGVAITCAICGIPCCGCMCCEMLCGQSCLGEGLSRLREDVAAGFEERKLSPQQRAAMR